MFDSPETVRPYLKWLWKNRFFNIAENRDFGLFLGDFGDFSLKSVFFFNAILRLIKRFRYARYEKV